MEGLFLHGSDARPAHGAATRQVVSPLPTPVERWAMLRASAAPGALRLQLPSGALLRGIAVDMPPGLVILGAELLASDGAGPLARANDWFVGTAAPAGTAASAGTAAPAGEQRKCSSGHGAARLADKMTKPSDQCAGALCAAAVNCRLHHMRNMCGQRGQRRVRLRCSALVFRLHLLACPSNAEAFSICTVRAQIGAGDWEFYFEVLEALVNTLTKRVRCAQVARVAAIASLYMLLCSRRASWALLRHQALLEHCDTALVIRIF